jgi:hypothetical protein
MCGEMMGGGPYSFLREAKPWQQRWWKKVCRFRQRLVTCALKCAQFLALASMRVAVKVKAEIIPKIDKTR